MKTFEYLYFRFTMGHAKLVNLFVIVVIEKEIL